MAGDDGGLIPCLDCVSEWGVTQYAGMYSYVECATGRCVKFGASMYC